MSAAKRKARSLAQPRIVIAGGGLAGLSLALALKIALSDGVEVVMCDPALKRDPHGDKRSYAIAVGLLAAAAGYARGGVSLRRRPATREAQ